MPSKKRVNRNGAQEPRLSVRCIVYDRWLSFPVKAETEISAGHPMFIRVMTRGADDRPKRICELCIIKEHLQSALEHMELQEGG